jgi:UDP-N-acetylglucosamine--N-acetylmuramyl-(pentapeptide) pyrophosphoryl-undecaprenol N-acetylglucosamine transferase
MNLLISGGGTGGHIYPGIAVAQGIQQLEPNTQLFYVGKKDGLEATIVAKSGLPIQFFGITAQGLSRKISRLNLTAIYRNVIGLKQSFAILSSVKPEVVFGTGGYVSASAVFAAQWKGIPTLILEQNLIPGLANKLLGKRAAAIALSFPETKKYFPKKKVVVTGTPVRLQLKNLNKPESRKFFKLEPNITTILVFGGSQGAVTINRAVISAMQVLEKKEINLQLILQTGQKNYSEIAEKAKCLTSRIMVVPYIDDMAKAYAAADLVISRSGAISIAEITVCGLPSILIPYPYATANHQEKNARMLETYGAAKVILESELTPEILAKLIHKLLTQPDLLSAMALKSKGVAKPDATFDICKIIQRLAKRESTN